MIFRITYTYFNAPRTNDLARDYFDALTIASHLRVSTGVQNVNILPIGVTL
jgi:hypothetical protein